MLSYLVAAGNHRQRDYVGWPKSWNWRRENYQRRMQGWWIWTLEIDRRDNSSHKGSPEFLNHQSRTAGQKMCGEKGPQLGHEPSQTIFSSWAFPICWSHLEKSPCCSISFISVLIFFCPFRNSGRQFRRSILQPFEQILHKIQGSSLPASTLKMILGCFQRWSLKTLERPSKMLRNHLCHNFWCPSFRQNLVMLWPQKVTTTHV